MKSGWWKISFTGITEPDDIALENIASLIREGFTEGEMYQEEEIGLSDCCEEDIDGDPEESTTTGFVNGTCSSCRKTALFPVLEDD